MGTYDGQEISEALAILLHEMGRARVGFDQDERAGTVYALIAVGRFVDYLVRQQGSESQHPQNLSSPLFRLATALNDLNRGVRAPMLLPNPDSTRVVTDEAEDKAEGRKAGVSFELLQGRATAAAAMEICMKTGMGEMEASRYVAKRIKDTIIAASGRGNPNLQPRNWRNEVRGLSVTAAFSELPADAPEPKQAAGTFNEIVRAFTSVADCQSLTSEQIRSAVDRLLASSHAIRPAPGKSEMPRGFPRTP